MVINHKLLCLSNAGYSEAIVRRALKGVESVVLTMNKTLEKENRQLKEI